MKLKEDERIDDLHRKGYKIIQNPNKFCFGIDAVLLSSFANVKEKEKVLDLGTGTGIIPILLEAKTKGEYFVGLEIQEESAEMASRSVMLNNLEKKVSIIQGDIKEADKLFPLSSFDVITSNPPYMNNKNGLKNDKEPKSIARHEILCTLEDVIKTASSLVKVGGRFYMVHRPSRLPEIIIKLKQYKLEPKRIRLVHPYIDKEPNMVLIESVRHGKPLLKVEAPLVVYEEVGKYTNEIYDIYGYNE
ncbi:MAG: tRNA1(Val) (adenine(37)-N6)-methyltransferase [Vallitalea sp.]|jgi:tRNA1(Val) A37 N6-methylase TrmN6|nr:tRNA1(Val) (adenine(37)-N6)-methyltransferase [Vallitalea sp.]